MIRAFRIALVVLPASLGAAAVAMAQQSPATTGSAALRRAAKISDDSARAIASAVVPNGTIQSGELEREKGRLIYSYDIKVAGKEGVEEVNVDATTGKVVAHRHESAKTERKEAARDRAAATGTAASASQSTSTTTTGSTTTVESSNTGILTTTTTTQTTETSTALQPAGTYRVTKSIAVGGEGGWDYLLADSASHRLYLSRGTHVMVLDTDRDSVIADIQNTPGVHGIALAPELNRGFTSNGRDSSVTIFDTRTFAQIAHVNIGSRNPDAILYDPGSRRVFTFNGGSNNATAIDAATGTVAGTVSLGGKPETAVVDRMGRVIVNVEDKSQMIAFDPRTLAVQATWPLAPCEEPSGLAIDRAHDRVFAGCSNKLMAVVDLTSGRVVTTVPIGQGVDANGFDPSTQLAFSSNGEGTLTVVHEDTPDRYTVVATVPTERGARTMTLDPRTHKIYTVTAQFGPPPAATADRPRPRPPMLPGTFHVLVLQRS